MKSISLLPLILSLTLIGSFLSILSNTVQAAPTIIVTLEVDTTLDSNDTAYQACTPAPNDCSLRGAVSQANADPANNYIVNLPLGTYTFTRAGSGENNNATGDLDLQGIITFQGAGKSVTIIDANQLDRVIQTDSSAHVTLHDLTIANGKTPDGGAGAAGGNGSGIYNSGTLTVTQSLIHNNNTGNGGMGGTDMWGNGDRGGDGGDGGAIYNTGNINLHRVTLNENQSGAGGGGGIGGNCFPPICSPGRIGDGGPGGNGGNGAAIFNVPGGVLTITNSTLNNNFTGNGGDSNEPDGGSPPVLAGDGGLGGGIYNAGVLTMSNSSLSGNATGNGGNSQFETDYTAGSGGHGGSLYNVGSLSLVHVTITANRTGTIGTFGNPGAGASDGLGGGLYAAAGPLVFQNSIIAANDSLENANDDCYGTLTSKGYNLVGSGTGCPTNGTGDQVTANALLGSLADNAGPTFTHALLSGSPAIDRIPDGANGCIADESIDQRGCVRAGGNNRGGASCDIGAYEYDSNETPTAVSLQSFSPQPVIFPVWLVFLVGILLFATLRLIRSFKPARLRKTTDLAHDNGRYA